MTGVTNKKTEQTAHPRTLLIILEDPSFFSLTIEFLTELYVRKKIEMNNKLHKRVERLVDINGMNRERNKVIGEKIMVIKNLNLNQITRAIGTK